MKVTLRKVMGGEQLRTDLIEGVCEDLPRIGYSFRMFGLSFDHPDGVRLVTTSSVKIIEHVGDEILFETINSKYALHIDEHKIDN